MNANIAIISISGPDAKKFLQGQLTCDLEEVKEQEWHIGAHCNPKGRVISLFDITLLNNSYYLRLPSDMLTIAMDALKKYAVFFKVSMSEARGELSLPAIKNTKAHKIRHGIPDVYPSTTGKYLPHELNLHHAGGVSTTKGCYTGQEIIARMHYLGKLKTRLYLAKINSQNLTPGQDVYARDSAKPVASLVDFCDLEDGSSITLILTDNATANAGNLQIDDKLLVIETDFQNGTPA